MENLLSRLASAIRRLALSTSRMVMLRLVRRALSLWPTGNVSLHVWSGDTIYFWALKCSGRDTAYGLGCMRPTLTYRFMIRLPTDIWFCPASCQPPIAVGTFLRLIPVAALVERCALLAMPNKEIQGLHRLRDEFLGSVTAE